ncbi:hypothetical protein CathTA2_0329 [Caldalkalibacillus thermarum TA2.A1]|uniref:Uncharacterized protein n=1 Tax=Caldalkalibacillus thermarum (strain TA2.A1) TaxID=986075 RepID=F5L3G8_CALTT|nr:hypothetical protein CathTA2_0329 [Caldalkalibacillus thermarum TA2.A1]
MVFKILSRILLIVSMVFVLSGLIYLFFFAP